MNSFKGMAVADPDEATRSIPVIDFGPAFRGQPGGLAPISIRGRFRMRAALWLAFFIVANVLGVQALTAALTLPFEERLLPALLTVPLIGLAAMGAARLAATWQRQDRDL